ncbi:hypothetical protein PIB30_077421 [Stylosanthes scabra]|uniref:Uncharacterized protein n=1 Tax=Stylosanthes scabra TaxID=79078 RepID=A0ABU6YQ01_9FABA|nr:hypothetical protein [Stylosanthes scabra]
MRRENGEDSYPGIPVRLDSMKGMKNQLRNIEFLLCRRELKDTNFHQVVVPSSTPEELQINHSPNIMLELKNMNASASCFNLKQCL